MIKASFVYGGEAITGFSVSGHAGSGPYGHDLVCAAVSAVVFGGLNALEENEGAYDIDIKEGAVSLRSLRPIGTHDRIVLSTIERQLRSIEASYPGHLELERKETDEIHH